MTDKETTADDEIATLKTTLGELTTKLSKVQGKITTAKESLKLKIAERQSKKQILKSYGQKADSKVPSAENAIIT